MYPMIRGTAVTLHQRENRGHRSQRVRFNGEYGQNFPFTSSRSGYANDRHLLPIQTQAFKLSAYKSFGSSELEQSLNTWQDPEDNANEHEARQRILACHREVSSQLDLSFLDLSTLPDAIGRMQYLESLNISNNRFSEIPSILADLPQLKILNISNNVLREIPETIKRLKSLQVLNAACNQLRNASDELARLPMVQTVILSHNRIMHMPNNIFQIQNLEYEDQVAPASFAHFSSEFATHWTTTFQHEAGADCFELWLARYEQIASFSEAARYSEAFHARIGLLLNAMINNPHLRTLCYEYAERVIGTCHDGILFSLFEMEIKLVEERMVAGKLAEEEICQEMERAFNFYRLQELAIMHAERQVTMEGRSFDGDEQADALETALFFYTSPANTLEMPLGGDRPRFMRYPELSNATDSDVQEAVEQIRREKERLGQDLLIDFVSDKEFWMHYLTSRYAGIITEHTEIFMDQMNELEDKQNQMNENDYLKRINALVKEKNDSEKILYRQLTKNIVLQ